MCVKYYNDLFTQDIYGQVKFHSDLSVPKEKKIGKFTELAHNVKSGYVIIEDAKSLFIPKFHYYGTATRRPSFLLETVLIVKIQ